jgi:predicted protein tyrosine phosphatase
MAKISHVPLIDVLQKPPTSGVIISIRDPGNTYSALYSQVDAIPNVQIIPIYAFDVNEEIHGCLTETDAAIIAKALIEQSELGNDVIVHCTAGICRSGAVAEVGMALALFEKQRTNRQPNTLFKRKIMRAIYELKPEQYEIAFANRGN